MNEHGSQRAKQGMGGNHRWSGRRMLPGWLDRAVRSAAHGAQRTAKGGPGLCAVRRALCAVLRLVSTSMPWPWTWPRASPDARSSAVSPAPSPPAWPCRFSTASWSRPRRPPRRLPPPPRAPAAKPAAAWTRPRPSWRMPWVAASPRPPIRSASASGSGSISVWAGLERITGLIAPSAWERGPAARRGASAATICAVRRARWAVRASAAPPVRAV
jgi:hypothetical protein